MAFVRVLYAVGDLFERSPIPPILRVAAGGLIVGGLLIVSPHLYGTGFESIGMLLAGELTWQTAAMLILLKPLACSITIGSGGSGGVFSSALFIGAAVGYTFGELGHLLLPGWIPEAGPYALVGMGAVLSAATHAPVASILILFELTGDYAIILPLMLAVTLSTVGSRMLDRDSVYTRKLRRKGVHLFGAPDDATLSAYKVRDVMRKELPTIPASAPFGTVLDRFLSSTVDEVFVVRSDGALVGTISLHDVKGLVGDDELRELVIAGDIANAGVPTLSPDISAAQCLQEIAATGRESLPVVAHPGSRIPVGLVTRRDLIDLYDRVVLRRDMLGTYSPEQSQAPALPVGHRLEEVPIPNGWAGRTLRELDLRRRTGITVLGIQHQGRFDISVIADPELRLRAGDRLVVFADHRSMIALQTVKLEPLD